MTLDIMMPFYGRFDHLKLAVESVLAQSDPDWRLVVVDDVYPDLAPGQWVAALEDERVTYIRNEVNLRPSRNYMKCVGLMESPFAVLMGCDDIMLPGYVARVKELIGRFPDASIIQPGVAVIDGNGNPSSPLADRVKRLYRFGGHGPRSFGGQPLAKSLLRGNWTYFPSLCWRVDALRQHTFRTDLDVVQDLAMLLEITKDGGRLVLDDEVVFTYRRHSESVSAVTGPDGSKFAQERVLFAEAERDLTALGWHGAARAARLHVTSRLNALSELPAALLARNRSGLRSLLRHVFGPSAERSTA
ncbi:glycosyltransferase family 2 protein [Mycetocola sp. 2940]|uniref:glycosyltransferase family 2 protein n=1 Tax=Mycetocola sp. 2940 TaxID=3156452 RepID=UPI00339747C7